MTSTAATLSTVMSSADARFAGVHVSDAVAPETMQQRAYILGEGAKYWVFCASSFTLKVTEGG
jgi:hypothetical protein